MPQVVCQQCSISFHANQDRINRGKAKFCSKPCAGLFRHLATRIEVICQQCTETFYVKSSRFDDKRGKFCSRQCHLLYVSMHGQPYEDLADRFWRQVNKTETCWLWTGHQNNHGYGWFRIRKPRNQVVYAHRLAWELLKGPIPDGLWILHRCDVPLCCNVDHLFLGTARDNVADAISKGRHPMAEAHPSCRFTNAQVREIKALKGKMKQADVARLYGVDHKLIQYIWNGTTYKSVT